MNVKLYVFYLIAPGWLSRQPQKEVTDLMNKIKAVMFDASNSPIVMTNDLNGFCVMMDAFHNYEKHVSVG